MFLYNNLVNTNSARTTYDTWYSNNRPKLIESQFNPIDITIVSNPESDNLRGLNIISYVPEFISSKAKKAIIPLLDFSDPSCLFIFPEENLHITILDLIPHNAGWEYKRLQEIAPKYAEVIDSVIQNFREPININIEGIFASPDGITLQGIPSDSLGKLRELIREALVKADLINIESTKYVIQTAHIALLKFLKPIDGQKLVEVVDRMREAPFGRFTLDKLVLNISGRYDKVKTVEVIEEFEV